MYPFLSFAVSSTKHKNIEIWITVLVKIVIVKAAIVNHVNRSPARAQSVIVQSATAADNWWIFICIVSLHDAQ